MDVNFDDIAEVCDNYDKLHAQLVVWGLVPSIGTYKCKKCGGALKLSRNVNAIDGRIWFCNNQVSIGKQKRKECGYSVSYRSGTFFARSHLPIKQILEFVCLWVENASLRLMKRLIRVHERTIVEWSSFCREVVLNAYIDDGQKLGGEGVTIEIHESKFGKRKYHRGHAVEGQWIFGGYERGSGRVFMVPVEDRGCHTLLPIIQDWILPGTTIISNFWKAYDCLKDEAYNRLMVNHKLHFEDPSTGRIKEHVPGNLARYMFDKRCDELGVDRAVEFYRLAGLLYSPTADTEPVDDVVDDEGLLL